MLNPGMAGTHEILDSISTCPTVRRLVLTSSVSAAAPRPEPAIKDESHWSDDVGQLSHSNYYGCLKTRQERLCHEWTKSQNEKGRIIKLSNHDPRPSGWVWSGRIYLLPPSIMVLSVSTSALKLIFSTFANTTTLAGEDLY